MVCFKCSGPNRAGIAATGHAMRKDWYETALPSRTVYLCEDCYVPDRLAGKRTEAVWEQHESLWEAFEHEHRESEWEQPEWEAFDRREQPEFGRLEQGGGWDNGVRALENAA